MLLLLTSVVQSWLRSRGDGEKARRARHRQPSSLKDRTGQDDEREGNKTGNHEFGEVLRKRWQRIDGRRAGAGAEEACA